MREQRLRTLSAITPCLLVLATIVFFTGLARSEYPERPVTLIVAFDPGGPMDVLARVIVAGAEKHLRKPIVIENKGGGGGTVGLAVVANAKPDGYTLCYAPNISIVHTPLMQRVTFKPLKSFTPIIAHAAGQNTALVVRSGAPWKTFREFIEYAKKNPGKIKYSSAGVGTSVHVVMEYVARQDKLNWIHVPYKGGAPALTALLGGHVDACSAAVDFVPHAQSGAIRVLATHGEKRTSYFPDVPTLKELGYDVIGETLHSIVGPAGLPEEIVMKLESAFTKGTETPDFKATVARLYLTPAYYNSKDYQHYLKEFWVKSEKMFNETGIIKEAATQPY